MMQIEEMVRAWLTKPGVEIRQFTVENEVDQTLATEDGYAVTRGTGLTTLTIKIYDPSHDEVK